MCYAFLDAFDANFLACGDCTAADIALFCATIATL